MSAGIFFIDLDRFQKACVLGMNAAISYLVIARGTLRDHSTSGWSVNSIEKRTGISRHRAKAALQLLDANNLVKPRRVRGLPGHSIQLSDEPNLVALPNSLIDGAASEVPPIERLRRSGSIASLRMLVEMYADHDLPGEGGMDWRLFRMNFDAHPVATRGRFRIVGFSSKELICKWESPLRKQFGVPSSEANDAFWSAFKILREQGLAEIVEHLVEGIGEDREIIVPLPISSGTPLEMAITDAARDAYRTILDGDSVGYRYEADEYEAAAPIPDDFPDATLVGVIRLRYRPHTRRTAAWIALSDRMAEYEEAFRSIQIAAEAGQPIGGPFLNPARKTAAG